MPPSLMLGALLENGVLSSLIAPAGVLGLPLPKRRPDAPEFFEPVPPIPALIRLRAWGTSEALIPCAQNGQVLPPPSVASFRNASVAAWISSASGMLVKVVGCLQNGQSMQYASRRMKGRTHEL